MKRAASAIAQLVTTYGSGEGTPARLRARLEELGVSSQLVDAAGPLLIADASSVGQVVYPQLAGYVGDEAAVMVIVRQRLRADGRSSTRTRVLDLRLRRDAGRWGPTGLLSVGGVAPADPAPMPESARLVLASKRITLPDSARWDILAGKVDQRVLDLLLTLAERVRLSVTTFATGHPPNVFGTERRSNHTVGRAVDVWAIDGVPVADQRAPGGSLEAVVRSLPAAGVTELGSPYDFDGLGGAMFTNTVHLDHLHLGLDR